MANINAPFGGRAVVNANGNSPKARKYVVAAGQTIGQGSPVCITGSREVTQYTNALALTGDFLGFAANAATAGQDVWVHDDPDTIFEIQITGAATVAAGDYNAMFRFAASPEAVTALTGQSTASMDIATAGITVYASSGVAAPLRLLDYPKRADNEIANQNAVVQVMIVPTYHAFGHGSLGLLAADTYTTA